MSTAGELTTQKSTFIWNISGFSKKCAATGDVISSPNFQLANSAKQEHEWCMNLYPFGKQEDSQDYVSLFLKCHNSGQEIQDRYYYELSILDDTGFNINIHQCSAINNFKKDASSWGWVKFIERKKLFSKKDFLLIEDTLKISCYIEVNPCEDTHLNCLFEPLTCPYQLNKPINSLLNQNQNLFLSEKFSDLTIIIDNKEIKAHKCILSSKSKVFSAMLTHEMKESNTDIITITDVEYEVMVEFLRFLYFRSQVSHENAKSLIAVADKYDVEELKSLCEKILWEKIDIDDACEILCVADYHNCKKLRSNVMCYIITNAKEVINTESYEELTNTCPNLLKEIVRRLVEGRTETDV